MKNIVNLLFMVVLGIYMSSCSKKSDDTPAPPATVADFSIPTVINRAPTSVTITNLSTNATSYSWVVSNGQTSNVANPVFTFSNGGNFTITLTATGNTSSTATKNITIPEVIPTVADFSLPSIVNRAPTTVLVTNLSTNATSYSWSVSNGQTSSSRNPEFTFTNGGNYSISLTATGNTTSTITKNITIPESFSKVSISNITLEAYPSTMSNGGDWDSNIFGGTYPDIYPLITSHNVAPTSGNHSNSSVAKLDNLRNVDLPKTWVYSTPIEITNLSDPTIDFYFYDDDPGLTPAYIGGGFVTNWNSLTSGTNPYPTSIQLSINGTIFSLALNWHN